MSISPTPLQRPIRRTVYQLYAEVVSDSAPAAQRFEGSVSLIQDWLYDKLQSFPDLSARLADRGADWDIPAFNGFTIRSIYHDLGRGKKWALRFAHPDSSVPTRVWDVQGVVTLEKNAVWLSIDVAYSAAVEAEPPYRPVPGFAARIEARFGLRACGVPLRPLPHQVGAELEAAQLLELLTHPQRSLPVLVLSMPDRNKWSYSEKAPDYLVSGAELALGCFGTCIVVELPFSHSFELSKRIGRNWSVFDGGVRLYRPNLDFDEDGLYKHPLFIKSDIMRWACREPWTPQLTFERYLDQLINTSPIFFPRDWEHDTFSQVLQERLELERVTAHMDAKRQQRSYEEQISDLNREAKKQRDTAESLFSDSLKRTEEVSKLREDIRNLSLYNDALLHAIKASGQDTDLLIPTPDSYEEMDAWCRKYFPDRLLFTPRARRAVKDPASLYDNVPLVYQCLMLLANEYRDMRRGFLDAAVFEEKCRTLHVENRPSSSKTQAGMFKEEYYIDHNGRRRLLDMHLTRGEGWDPHNLLRIYYYWDEEEEKVVIGSLTNHLTTQAT